MSILSRLKSYQRNLASNIKADLKAAVKTKAGELKEAIGPEKAKSSKPIPREFGREGAEDVKDIVWSGHKVQNASGQSYFGAVGLTQQGYYRTAEVQVYGADEKWRWQEGRHSVKADAISKAESVGVDRLKPPPKVKAATVKSSSPPVMSPNYFPNVWQSKPVNTPSGKLVGVVNMDTSDGKFYAGVHHFPKNPEQESAVRWAHQPHATKGQAVKRAETFVRRGARSMHSRHSQVQRLAKEYREDAAMGRGEMPSETPAMKYRDSNVLSFKPKGPRLSR